jgi:hypothetical protein
MNPRLPTVISGDVSRSRSARCAMPKSSSFTRRPSPTASTKMLVGFKSR